MDSITGKYHNEVYHNNEFFICNYVSEGIPDDHTKYLKKTRCRVVSVKGNCLPKKSELCYKFSGEWKYDKNFGWSFAAESFEVCVEQTPNGILTYLKTIPGIGKTSAKKIVDHFGMDTMKVLEENPDRLLEIPGFTSNKMDKALKYIKDHQAFQHASRILYGLGVGSALIQKSFSALGKDAGEMVQKNPFALCRLGFSYFDVAEQISQNTGAALRSSSRVIAGLLYSLQNQEHRFGNVYSDYDALVDATSHVFKNKVSRTAIEKAIELAAEENRIVVQNTKSDKKLIYSSSLYYAEKGSAFIMAQMLAQPYVSPSEDQLDEYIRKVQCNLQFVLDRTQIKAIKMGIQNPVSIITGGPGTGKTTILKILKMLFQAIWPDLPLNMMAPTGRAARKMAEDAEWPSACTIHKQFSLEAADEDSSDPDLSKIYSLGSSSYAQEPAIYIGDEFSMVDIILFYQTLLRMSPGSHLVLVGDPGQLPSVGPGNVLKDLIASGVVPTTKLNVIHRQSSEESKIVINADRINNGIKDVVLDTDFQFIECANSNDTEEIIINQFISELHNGIPIDELQILSPYKKPDTICSTKKLNDRLQEILNPKSATKAEIYANNYIFRTGDKVIQQKNVSGNDDRPDVMNGDIGYIKSITTDEENTSILIDFGDNRLVTYYKNELVDCNLALGYCVTVHKYQGSECETVIMPIIEEHSHMLVRNLVYTAVTRASDKVILVGQMQQLKYAISKNKVSLRNTLLAIRLKKYFPLAQMAEQKKLSGAKLA